MEDKETYIEHLGTLGLDASTLVADEAGALRPADPLATPTGGLPQLSLSEEDHPSAKSEFVVGSTIGQDGMGVVSAATQMSLGRRVAIKRIRSDRDGDAARSLLLREARVTGRLKDHPPLTTTITGSLFL